MIGHFSGIFNKEHIISHFGRNRYVFNIYSLTAGKLHTIIHFKDFLNSSA